MRETSHCDYTYVHSDRWSHCSYFWVGERTHVLEERACPANTGREERTHVLEERARLANIVWEERTHALEERACPANTGREERTPFGLLKL